MDDRYRRRRDRKRSALRPLGHAASQQRHGHLRRARMLGRPLRQSDLHPLDRVPARLLGEELRRRGHLGRAARVPYDHAAAGGQASRRRRHERAERPEQRRDHRSRRGHHREHRASHALRARPTQRDPAGERPRPPRRRVHHERGQHGLDEHRRDLLSRHADVLRDAADDQLAQQSQRHHASRRTRLRRGRLRPQRRDHSDGRDLHLDRRALDTRRADAGRPRNLRARHPRDRAAQGRTDHAHRRHQPNRRARLGGLLHAGHELMGLQRSFPGRGSDADAAALSFGDLALRRARAGRRRQRTPGPRPESCRSRRPASTTPRRCCRTATC
jgi:hypothetical protein